MPDKKESTVSEHGHCVVCGRPVPVRQPFCSDECERTLRASRRRQRNSTWIFLGVIVLLVLFWLLVAGRSAG